MRIFTLLQKISELTRQPESRTTIDVDLMLDYTRVLYADLLEWKAKLARQRTAMPAINEPTLAELAEAMDKEEGNEQIEITDQSQPDFPTIPKNILQQPIIEPRTPNSKPQIPNQKDIRSLISINDKYQILSELFGNDSAAYEEALNYINEADSEATAVKWLQERLWVKEESGDAALGFYDLVRRFKNQNRDLQD